jgi:nicotinate phosphoribosyltransferase
MAQGYWASGKADTRASFLMYFRDYPFKGGYAIACGMAQLREILEGFKFTQADIEYLAGLEGPAGGALFCPEFLDYLRTFELELDVFCVREGTVVFPHEPVVRVEGPILQCQLVETALLNVVNFETLIATKAARVCQAAKGAPVAEFGLRRAQGTGGMWASRAAVVGGCASTSNVAAGAQFDIPVSGTHSHSWVMSFESELEAFREYARQFPNNCTLLVDTYNVETGVQNAITVGREMRARGQELGGIRIDSGDLSWLSKMARRMLDEAGFENVSIVLSNDLDEHTITSILDEGAPVNAWGIGTKLATAYDQPTLGGVYKLSAVMNAQGEWIDRLKVSESAAKITMPGRLNTRRFFNECGSVAGDMVFDEHRPVEDGNVIIDPLDPLRQKQLDGKRHVDLLVPFFAGGHYCESFGTLSAAEAQKRAKGQLACLDETQLRLLNPHTYPVGFEAGMHKRRSALVSELRALK